MIRVKKMKGHKFLSKPIVRNLTINAKKKQGAYYYRRIHIFYKNECILEVDFTGFLHLVHPLANIGDISFHVDAGATLESLSLHKKNKKGNLKKLKGKRKITRKKK